LRHNCIIFLQVDLEKNLKQSHWCTYVSNAGLIGVFSKYRENLAQHLKEKDVLTFFKEWVDEGHSTDYATRFAQSYCYRNGTLAKKHENSH
jgi:hypothetical protein